MLGGKSSNVSMYLFKFHLLSSQEIRMPENRNKNPEHVYLFYDDFTDTKLERKWQKNWGTVRVENGVLTVRTGKTPTNEHVEISVFVRHGYDWEDIEVELDFLDRNKDKYPGPFLRVQDAGLKSTSGWWFEYHTGNKRCTMRPLKSNNDGSWLYRGNLNKPLSLVSWTHAKYRVVGDRLVLFCRPPYQKGLGINWF